MRIQGKLLRMAAWAGIAAGSLAFANSARAALVLELQADGQMKFGAVNGNDVTFNGTVGNFVVNIVIANSDHANSTLSINAQSITNVGAGPGSDQITVSLQDTDFAGPISGGSLQSTASITFSGADSATFQSFADATNAQGGTGTSTVTQSATGPGSQILTPPIASSPFSAPGAYSIENVTTLTLAPGATATLAGTTTVVPEPATLGAFGLGSLLLMRRRRA